MARRDTDDHDVDAMIEEIADLLERTIARTLETGSPEPARSVFARIVEVDEDVTAFSGEMPPGQLFALVTLARWLTVVRPGPESAVADEVLCWIGEHLGPRYRARARYLVGVLDPATATETVQLYADALADDFQPTLIWIAAALTAIYGDGDPAWLRRESAKAPPTASGPTLDGGSRRASSDLAPHG